MAFEYRIEFRDLSWYAANRGRVADREDIRALFMWLRKETQVDVVDDDGVPVAEEGLMGRTPLARLMAAAKAPIDRSADFTARAATLATIVTKECGVAARHDASMNYAASQAIWWVEGAAWPRIKAVFLVSARADFCTSVIYKESRPNEWHRISIAHLPESAARNWATVKTAFVSFGYEYVPEAVLASAAPGLVTEMDGAPASLMDVLFTELA